VPYQVDFFGNQFFLFLPQFRENKALQAEIIMFNQEVTLEALNKSSNGTIMEQLGIEFTEIGDNYLVARMPVDHRTHQPYGVLHGGASVVLAETLGSQAAASTLNLKKQYCVGLDINANHIRSKKDGYVTGTARPVHIGRTTQVWEIKITDEHDKLIAVSRITLAIIDIKD